MPLITSCAVIIEMTSLGLVKTTIADIHTRLARLRLQPTSFSTVTLDDGKVVFELVFRTADEAQRFDEDFRW